MAINKMMCVFSCTVWVVSICPYDTVYTPYMVTWLHDDMVICLFLFSTCVECCISYMRIAFDRANFCSQLNEYRSGRGGRGGERTVVPIVVLAAAPRNHLQFITQYFQHLFCHHYFGIEIIYPLDIAVSARWLISLHIEKMHLHLYHNILHAWIALCMPMLHLFMMLYVSFDLLFFSSSVVCGMSWTSWSCLTLVLSQQVHTPASHHPLWLDLWSFFTLQIYLNYTIFNQSSV